MMSTKHPMYVCFVVDLKIMWMTAACKGFNLTFCQAYKWLYTHFSAARNRQNRVNAKRLRESKEEKRKEPNPRPAKKERKTSKSRSKKKRKRKRKKKRDRKRKKKKKKKKNSDDTDSDSSSSSSSSSSDSSDSEDDTSNSSDDQPLVKKIKVSASTAGKKRLPSAPTKTLAKKAPPKKKPAVKKVTSRRTTAMEDKDEEDEEETVLDTGDESDPGPETFGRSFKKNEVSSLSPLSDTRLHNMTKERETLSQCHRNIVLLYHNIVLFYPCFHPNTTILC